MDSNVNNGIGSRYDPTLPAYSDYARSYLAAQGIGDHVQSTSAASHSSDGSASGCVLPLVAMFGVWLAFYLPASGLAYVCQMVGLHPYWGLRLLAAGAIGGFGFYLHREWTSLQRLKEAFGLETVTEWRARRPGGLHRFPLWYSIAGTSLLILFVLMWGDPLYDVVSALMGVFFFATFGGLLFGSMAGVVFSWVDQARLEKILKEKGPLLSPRPTVGESIPDDNFL